MPQNDVSLVNIQSVVNSSGIPEISGNTRNQTRARATMTRASQARAAQDHRIGKLH